MAEATDNNGRASLRDMLDLQTKTFALVQGLDDKFVSLDIRLAKVEIEQANRKIIRDRRSAAVAGVIGAVSATVCSFVLVHALPVASQILPALLR